jgi:hypothetical protein
VGQPLNIRVADDNANWLTQITRGTPTVTFTCDNANRLSTLTLPNGAEMSYDAKE